MVTNIYILESGKCREAWSSLADACKAHPELCYQDIRTENFPIRVLNFVIHKLRVNQTMND